MTPEFLKGYRELKASYKNQTNTLTAFVRSAMNRIPWLSDETLDYVEVLSDEDGRVKITYHREFSNFECTDPESFCLPFSCFESVSAFVAAYNAKTKADEERNKRLEEKEKQAEEARKKAEEIAQESNERAELKRLSEKYGTKP